jgi:hypothetical protein
MHEQLDALLCKRYPAIFSIDDLDDPRVFGFECGDGWFTLIDAACALIQRQIDTTGTQQLVASQVKEKFGGLRFYYRQGNDYAASVVDLAESLSTHVCEVCGALGKVISASGWMRARCKEHESTTAYDDAPRRGIRDKILLAPSMGELLGACLEFFAFDSQAAARWLTQPVLALGHSVPLALAGCVEGQSQVITLIGRLEHGIIP